MKVKEALQNPANQFDEAIGGNPTVTSAVSKQYLESVRGHYLSALAGLNTGKQGQAKVFHNLDAITTLVGNDSEQVAEAKKTYIEGQLDEGQTFTEMDMMDMEVHLSNGVMGTSEKKLPAIKVQLNKTLAKNNAEKISEMVSRIGAFGQEMENDATEFEANRSFLSESGGLTESLLKGVIEGSSLQRMVKSLKAELENLKKEHAELKDKGAGAEFATGNLHCKLLERTFEDEGCLMNEPVVRRTLEETVQNQQDLGDLKIKGKGLKRAHETSKISSEGEKKSRVALGVDEAKGSKVKSIARNKSLPERTYPVCVSTSESSARMMISEDGLEASSLKEEKSDKLERKRLTTTTIGRVVSEKYDYASEFSIRDYVFAARDKDISLSWPFSQKNLQLCLKCGVKDVLPPFQPMDSFSDNSMKRFVAETSCNSEESKLDNKPLLPKKHLVTGTTMDHQWNQELAEGYRDANSFPSEVEKNLAFKTTTTANSEVESVSTSCLPVSEVSDEQAAAASAVNDSMKSPSSQLSDKKYQMSVKMGINPCRSAAEDISSACTVPGEAMTSKICPVCEAFSSSSNTTLNAHIDQCLSSQSNPNWFKSSKLLKPRVKPRKIRLMSDICATAPCCTLEDLDRRNGTNWATNAECPVQDTQAATEMNSHRVSSRYVGDDAAVYIDSSGRKIRILSKFNDTLSLSSSKARVGFRSEKQSKKGMTSKFFSSSRKRHLAKHLKYLKVNRQKRQLSSLKLKGRSNEAFGAEEATSARGEKHVEELEFVQFAKTQEQNTVRFSGSSRLWISSKRSSLSKKYDSKDISRHCRYELRMTKDRQAHNVPSGNGRMHMKKHSGSLRKCISAQQRSARPPALYKAETDKRSEGSCTEGTMDGPPLRGAIQINRDSYLVPLKLGAAQFNGHNTKESQPRSMNSTVTPSSSLDGEVHLQADAVENVDILFSDSRKLSVSSDVVPFEGTRSQNSNTKRLSSSLSPVHAYQSNSTPKSSSLEKSFGCGRNDGGDLWSIESIDQCHMMIVQKGRGMEFDDDVPRDGNRTHGLPSRSPGVYGRVRSSIGGLHDNGEVIAPPVSSSGLDSGETVINLSSSSGLELQKIVDVQDPKSSSLQCSDKFQVPLFRTEVRSPTNEATLRDDHEMFRNVVGAERLQFETRDSDFNMGFEISFPEVDPILIPGPPGSDLPSFSDMGSEDLHRNSSLSASLAQSSGDGDYVVDGDLSDSPLSATSTISNMGLKGDANVSEPMTVTLPVSDSVYPQWLGASSEPLVGTPATLSEFATSDTESVIAQGRGPPAHKGDSQQCRCSRKEGIPWRAALSMEESQLGKNTGSILNRRPNFLDSKTSVFPINSCARGESASLAYPIENSHQGVSTPLEVTADARVSFSRAVDCDSASPSAPILRLMGKDLMVMNKERDDLSRGQTAQNACANSQVRPVSELSSGLPSWQHQFSQGTIFMAAAVHEQDSRTFATRHLNFGSSNMMNNSGSPNQPSGGGGMVNKRMHANFTMPSSSSLQRYKP